jgi:hypothetical protein
MSFSGKFQLIRARERRNYYHIIDVPYGCVEEENVISVEMCLITCIS